MFVKIIRSKVDDRQNVAVSCYDCKKYSFHPYASTADGKEVKRGMTLLIDETTPNEREILIGDNCSVFVLNNEGKTIDTLHRGVHK